jgi:hypothetical protein
MRKRTLVILGASSILALGIAAPVAAAANNDPKPHQQQLASALAKELGVEESKVTAALEKLHEQQRANFPEGTRPTLKDLKTFTTREDLKTRLDKAVEEGKLTRAEADAVLKAVEAGVLGPQGGHLQPGGPQGDQPGGPQGDQPGGPLLP